MLIVECICTLIICVLEVLAASFSVMHDNIHFVKIRLVSYLTAYDA